MRRTLIAILSTVLWLLVGQVWEQPCGDRAQQEIAAVQERITDRCGDILCGGEDDMLLPSSEPAVVGRCGGAASVRGASGRTGNNAAKIFASTIADRHAGRVTYILDFDIRRSAHCVKRYLHVLRRLRI